MSEGPRITLAAFAAKLFQMASAGKIIGRSANGNEPSKLIETAWREQWFEFQQFFDGFFLEPHI